MSDRRAARGRQAAPAIPAPVELGSRLHPIWRDEAALLAHPTLGQYVDEQDVRRMRVGANAYQSVRRRWALDRGFESKRYSGFVDEHRLRAHLEALGIDATPERGGNGRLRLSTEPGALS